MAVQDQGDLHLLLRPGEARAHHVPATSGPGEREGKGAPAKAFLASEGWHAVTPSLEKLAEEAWTDADAMTVLVDRLLSDGLISPAASLADQERRVAAYGPNHSAKDDALFYLECRSREWILKLYHQRYATPTSSPPELRVTGPWPDIRFVVWGVGKTKAHGDLTFRISVFGVPEQPRLLREPISPQETS